MYTDSQYCKRTSLVLCLSLVKFTTNSNQAIIVPVMEGVKLTVKVIIIKQLIWSQNLKKAKMGVQTSDYILGWMKMMIDCNYIFHIISEKGEALSWGGGGSGRLGHGHQSSIFGFLKSSRFLLMVIISNLVGAQY